MTNSTHVAIGALIGYSIANPVLCFVLALISHFAVDMIPHGDSGLSDNYRVHNKNKKSALAYVTIDVTIAIYLLLVFAQLGPTYGAAAFSAAIVGATLPDFLTGVYEVTKTKYLKKFMKVHFFFHDFFTSRFKDIKLSYAIAYQAAFIAVVFAII